MRAHLLLVLAVAACDPAPPEHAAVPDSAVSVDLPPSDAEPTRERVARDPVIDRWLTRVDPSVFMRWGACPFECCVYRDWVAEAPVVVRAQPDSTAAVLSTIPAGQRFEADTGFVRITSAQLVVVTEIVEAWRVSADQPGGAPDSLAPGDTVLVLEYEGEGHYLLTDGATIRSAGQFWRGADGWEPHGGARGLAIGEHEAEWWAHVRTADGTEGWIDAYASELGNVDACGVPM